MNANSGLDSKETQDFIKEMVEIWDGFVEESGLGKDHPIVKGLEEGRTLAQITGLTRDDLDVLYAHGFSLLNKGSYDKAVTIFGNLTMIDPLEGKNHYCLGVALQMMGKHEVARDTFLSFLMLEATNPDGYLRLGESMMALGDRDMAIGAFELAELEAKREGADPHCLIEAQQKLEMARNGVS